MFNKTKWLQQDDPFGPDLTPFYSPKNGVFWITSAFPNPGWVACESAGALFSLPAERRQRAIAGLDRCGSNDHGMFDPGAGLELEQLEQLEPVG